MTPLLLAALLAAGASAQTPPGWKLAWSDEFNGPDGAAPDTAKWTPETGGGGWGNGELEYYTDRRDNSRLRGGNLEIVARREEYFGSRSSTTRAGSFLKRFTASPFTSARLMTYGKFSQKYGRFEARMKIPAGKGLWPAFWLLGVGADGVGWPDCGEIDVMENVGHEPASVHGTIHGPGYSGADSIGSTFTLQKGAFADEFHLFAVEWDPAAVRFYVDGSLYSTLSPRSLPPKTRWVFDKPFFVILNLAVGGGWPGSPDDSLEFPKTLLVDYVRVYERLAAGANPPTAGRGAAPDAGRGLGSLSSIQP